jgi:argininosuccinate lyase
MNLMTMLKGLPLCYNKDMQEDKMAIFDSVKTASLCLQAMTPMLATMKIDKERMRSAASKGFINATDCADYLVRKGLPFRDAYAVTGQLVRSCIESNHTLQSLPLKEYKAIHNAFEKDIYESLDLNTCVEKRNVEGGPAPDAVSNQIERLKSELEELFKSGGKEK